MCEPKILRMLAMPMKDISQDNKIATLLSYVANTMPMNTSEDDTIVTLQCHVAKTQPFAPQNGSHR